MAKKRNPADATHRNVRAVKRRLAKLEAEARSNRPLLAKLRKVLSK